ncbi:MAG: hypothetical protein ACJAWV_001823 [Flammeovirgaceae bacterium]|jgi:hypothetical protein
MQKFLLASIFYVAAILCSSNVAQAQDFFKDANSFFGKYVKNGKVNYASIKSNPEGLDALVEMVANQSLAGKSADFKKAFYLNAYNISTIKGIVDKYPVVGPMKIEGFFKTKTHKIAGKSTTLNDLENKTIRPTYKDARVHFALVCAAKGCPSIANFAFMPSKVNVQLESQTKRAANSSYFTRVSAEKKEVKHSQLFDWYKADFLAEASSIVDYLNKYRTTKIPANYTTSTYNYDWNLNK